MYLIKWPLGVYCFTKKNKKKTSSRLFLSFILVGFLFPCPVKHCFSSDVQFEDDASVMPLMSAARLWSDLKNTVADESLFKNVAILLIVQVIKFCFVFPASVWAFGGLLHL